MTVTALGARSEIPGCWSNDGGSTGPTKRTARDAGQMAVTAPVTRSEQPGLLVKRRLQHRAHEANSPGCWSNDGYSTGHTKRTVRAAGQRTVAAPLYFKNQAIEYGLFGP